jgi:transposase
MHVGADKALTIRRNQVMQAITIIGLDIARSVFQVHGVDAEGNFVIRRQLKRRYVLAFLQKPPPCLIGIEACASSHYWSRELQGLGHTVRRSQQPKKVSQFADKRGSPLSGTGAYGPNF